MTRIRGEWSSRKVWVDDKLLSPTESQKVFNHSPDGFNWGYAGSGPAQLALALLLNNKKISQHQEAVSLHQSLKFEFIAALPQSDFSTKFDLDGWIERKRKQVKDKIQS